MLTGLIAAPKHEHCDDVSSSRRNSHVAWPSVKGPAVQSANDCCPPPLDTVVLPFENVRPEVADESGSKAAGSGP